MYPRRAGRTPARRASPPHAACRRAGQAEVVAAFEAPAVLEAPALAELEAAAALREVLVAVQARLPEQPPRSCKASEAPTSVRRISALTVPLTSSTRAAAAEVGAPAASGAWLASGRRLRPPQVAPAPPWMSV